MSTTPRLARGHSWLRALALALALLLPGAPSAAVGLTAPAALAVPGEIVEYDVLDAALRPPHRVLPRRPAPVPAPLRPASPAVPTVPLPSYGPDVLRTVVLRC